MIRHEFVNRVRYAETDKMGYLYYGEYPKYYEIGRAEMMRSLGFTYKVLEDEVGVMMPVVSLNIRYVRPAFYDEAITIRTELRRLPEKFITFHMELYNESAELVNGGSVKLCFVDIKTNETVSAPPILLDKLKPHFEKA